MDTPPTVERRMLAAFCAGLPRLREKAAEGFWDDRLEMHVEEVATGGSAVAACAELGLVATPGTGRPQTRGTDPGLAAAATDWLAEPEVVGDYACPLRRCGRRAGRDEQARPPHCAVAEKPMRFQSA